MVPSVIVGLPRSLFFRVMWYGCVFWGRLVCGRGKYRDFLRWEEGV